MGSTHITNNYGNNRPLQPIGSNRNKKYEFINSSKPIRYDFSTNINTNNLKSNKPYNITNIENFNANSPQPQLKNSNTLNLIFKEEGEVPNYTEYTYPTELNYLNYINNPDTIQYTNYNFEDYNYNFPEYDFENYNYLYDIDNNPKDFDNSIIKLSLNKSSVSSNDKTNFTSNLEIDNNSSFFFAESPIINFKKKKTILNNPLNNSNNSINNIYKNKKILQSSNINRLPNPKSIDTSIIDYLNNMGLREFEDFNPDLWKKFYPDEEEFFEYDKGDVIESQVKSENEFGETETYIGELNQYGEKNGFGRFFSSKIKRIGTWRNNRFTGWGREVRDNGDIYEGKFINGELIGKGIYKNHTSTYIGDFYNFNKHGKGELFTSKYHYIGDFYYNKIEGYGRMDIYNIGVYEGTFTNDEITGKGILMLKNGEKYEGEIIKGKMVGRGKAISKEGIEYEVNSTNDE